MVSRGLSGKAHDRSHWQARRSGRTVPAIREGPMRFRHDPEGQRLPIKLDATSNGECAPVALYAPAQQARGLALERSAAQAGRIGRGRRNFLVSARGAAATLAAHSEAFAAAGKRGGRYDIPDGATA